MSVETGMFLCLIVVVVSLLCWGFISWIESVDAHYGRELTLAINKSDAIMRAHPHDPGLVALTSKLKNDVISEMNRKQPTPPPPPADALRPSMDLMVHAADYQRVVAAMAELGFKADPNPKAINALGKSIPAGLVNHIIDAVRNNDVSHVKDRLGEQLAEHRKNIRPKQGDTQTPARMPIFNKERE